MRLSSKAEKPANRLGHLRSLFTWPLIATVLGGALWGTTLYKLHETKEHTRSTALKEAESLSMVYAHQLDRILDHIDHITLHLKYDKEHSNEPLDLTAKVRAGLFPSSSHFALTVVDHTGQRLETTPPDAAEEPDWTSKAFFQAHKDGAVNGLLINTPEAGHEGKTAIRFTRRFDTADGAFGGIVIITIEPAYFTSMINGPRFSKAAFHTIQRTDGVHIATRSAQGAYSAKPILLSPFTPENAAGVGHLSPAHFAHRQPNLVAWTRLNKFPLTTIVGLTEEDIFASYHEVENHYYQLAIAGSLILLLLSGLGVLYSRRLVQRKQQEDEVKKAYRLATDGARDGFYMVRPVYDVNNQICDFLVEDCNEFGARFYGTTRSELIGAAFTRFAPGAYVHQVIALFRHAMETGFYEDEFQVPPESPLQIRWLHRRLLRSGDGLAVTLCDISAVKQHQEELEKLANADAVTNLPNRHWLMKFLPSALAQAKTSNTMLALMFVDLDDFKNINDTSGHAIGDEMLRAVAKRLMGVIRPQDNVIRLGGDEFTVVLGDVESHDDVTKVAQRIVDSLHEPFVLPDGSRHAIRASIGISLFPHDGDDGTVLLKHADIAMYAAKANGKGHYRFYQPELSDLLVAKVSKEQALRKAIELDEFVLHYQPRVGATLGELRGMEALVRWIHPELGMVPPNDFIPIAEETGLIVPLGELVIKKACKQIAEWKAHHLPLVPISVNVSPRQFNQGNLGGLFAACMANYGIDASLIEIEITESCVIGETPVVTAELKAIEALGVKLLIDDFGTGYSSLSQLQRLDVDILKVDRAFTAQLSQGKEGEALFMAILSMAHVLGLGVVAEGVETMEQLRILQSLSCNEVQGFFISRPVPAADVPALLRKRFLLQEQSAVAL